MRKTNDDGGAERRSPLSGFAVGPNGATYRVIRAPRPPNTGHPPTEGEYWEPLFSRKITKTEATRHMRAIADLLALGLKGDGRCQ